MFADAYNQLIPSGCYDYNYDIIETNGYNLMSNILLFLSFLICYISLQGNYSTCLAGIISIISENNSQMIFSIIIAYMHHHMLNYPLRLLMSLILISFYIWTKINFNLRLYYLKMSFVIFAILLRNMLDTRYKDK